MFSTRIHRRPQGDPFQLLVLALAVGVSLIGAMEPTGAQSADTGQYRAAEGLAVYIGLMPASIVKGHPSGHPERAMHGGPSSAKHDYHLVAAVFDADSGARISDASVSARVAGLGLAGEWTRLEPMRIADTITYGAFLTLPADRYAIHLEVRRSGSNRAVAFDFRFDHRP